MLFKHRLSRNPFLRLIAIINGQVITINQGKDDAKWCSVYEAPVQKMLGCRDASNGYSEYICVYCGRGNTLIHQIHPKIGKIES